MELLGLMVEYGEAQLEAPDDLGVETVCELHRLLRDWPEGGEVSAMVVVEFFTEEADLRSCVEYEGFDGDILKVARNDYLKIAGRALQKARHGALLQDALELLGCRLLLYDAEAT